VARSALRSTRDLPTTDGGANGRERLGELRFVPLSEDHVEALEQLVADPDVLRFTRVPEPVPQGFVRAWIARYEEGRRGGTREGFAVVGEDGRFLGLALAPVVDRETRTAELGYIVAPAARGRGVATESLRFLTDWAFAEAGSERAELPITTDNEASRRVAARCGYAYEGTLRSHYVKPGLRQDTEIWARLAGDAPAANERGAFRSEAELRAFLGEPADLVRAKVHDRLNDLTRQFVERSPFVCLATSAPDGSCDVSPRGDPSGFVRILDERTLLLPERPGNRLADSLRNVLANSHVALLFIIPGIGDTFRVNGRASVVTDPELLAPCAVEGKTPKLGYLIEIDEAYTHCPKAFVRSSLWDPDRYVAREELPSSGEIHRSLNPDFDAEKYDRERAERYARREGFY
jgi:PPOX class probable FMN-dependent enzyme